MDDRYDCTPVIHLWHVIDRIFETTRGSTCIAFRSFFGVQGTEFSLIQWRWNMVCYDAITIPDSSDEPLSVIRASKVISQFLFASDQIAPRDSSVTAGVTNRNLETTWVWTRFFLNPGEEAQTDPAQMENVITLSIYQILWSIVNRNTSIESNFRVSGDSWSDRISSSVYD